MDDNADAKMILMPPHHRTGRDHQAQGCPCIMWLNMVQRDLTAYWTKQSTWLRTALCGGWCLRMALCTPSGAWQKRRKN